MTDKEFKDQVFLAIIPVLIDGLDELCFLEDAIADAWLLAEKSLEGREK